jgi:predicted kinase
MKPTLYLIRGVSGAGKSTFANNLFEAGIVHKVFEADDYFYMEDGEYKFDSMYLKSAHSLCQANTSYVLGQLRQSVAVSNTSTTEKEVKIYQDIATQHNANFVSIIVENRHNGVNIHNVPEDKLKQMKERFSVKL